MTTIPEYQKLQSEQKDRDRRAAICAAVDALEDAEATFKLEIEKINRCFDAFDQPIGAVLTTTSTTRTTKTNEISASPLVAQYA